MQRLPMAIYRAMRARPSYLNAFVPLSDDFRVRQTRRRNAILVDVLPPANLGHFPQDTIANALANRFGGFPTDFHVARYRERDFVVFLPEWVPCDQLLRRDTVSLGNFRLACFAWNPYAGAPRPPLSYKVWIRLVSLPYECWSTKTVAALVGGFGRFIRADDFTIRVADLSGYRCLIAVNHLHDIPENLDISFGDISLSVGIQLERWSRDSDVIRSNPHLNEHVDEHDPVNDPAGGRRPAPSDRGRRSSNGGSSNSDASWLSSEIRDRRRPVLPVDLLHRPCHPPPSAADAPHPLPSSHAAPVDHLSPPRLSATLLNIRFSFRIQTSRRTSSPPWQTVTSELDKLDLSCCTSDLKYTFLGIRLSASAPPTVDILAFGPAPTPGWTPLWSVSVGPLGLARYPSPPVPFSWTVLLGGPTNLARAGSSGLGPLGDPLSASSTLHPLPPLGLGSPCRPLHLMVSATLGSAPAGPPLARPFRRQPLLYSGSSRRWPPSPVAALGLDLPCWVPPLKASATHGSAPAAVAADGPPFPATIGPPSPLGPAPSAAAGPPSSLDRDAAVPPTPLGSPGPDGSPSPAAVDLSAPPGLAPHAPPSRMCARLCNRPASSALGRAMHRKARLLEGEPRSGTPARRWSRKKVQAKSRRCGVELSDADAAELCKFLRVEA
uniref:Uncharacterized protein n=1 Tax=Ananas comosus var. bracteatus TaxID=296719 RepID=A0A6V7QQ21_ANACO|nr:unnamed protein product [Ananas comosus var. bracteatus]